MTIQLLEQASVLIPTVPADCDTGLESARFYAVECESLDVFVFLAAGAAATAAQVVTIAVKAYEANSGGTATTVSFFEHYQANQATTLAAGTGKFTRTTSTTALTSVTTLAANGNKQELICIPVRTRRLPVGHKWISIALTGTTATRLAQFMVVRNNKQSQEAQNITSLY